MKIAFLGAGTWGFSLANLLADNGAEVCLWNKPSDIFEQLSQTKKHPKLSKAIANPKLKFTSDLEEALENCDLIAEAVTAQGVQNKNNTTFR